MCVAQSSVRSKRPRRIAIVDCDSFYSSCERIYKPAWKHRPVAVLSNNDGNIIARSHEIKEAGIPMGAPYFQCRDELQAINAIVVSRNYTLYGDISSRVMHTLGQFTPDVEVYSIDEAWLDLSGFEVATLDAYGRRIVETVQQHVGIPISIGIAPTKVLAKVALRICKARKIPGHVFNLGSAESLDEILSTIEVGDLWGIGRRWSKKLNDAGYLTAKDLRDADAVLMRRRFNVVMQRIILELRGTPCLDFEDIQPKKQIIASRSFGQRVMDIDPLLESVAMHATRAGEKLRAQGSVCRAIQVSIRTGRHNPNESYFGVSALAKFPAPTADTRKLINGACQGVKEIYEQGHRYAKAGVMLLDISPARFIQGDLFHSGDSDRTAKLMATIDRLNQLYGKRSLFFAREGIAQDWSMKRGSLTKAYTTRWEEVPVVK